MIVIRCRSNGEIIRTKAIQGQYRKNIAGDIALGSGGDIVVTGTSTETTPAWVDISHGLTVCLTNESGEIRWISYYDDAASNVGGFTSVTTDLTGNIYVSGRYQTVAYNPDGKERWAINEDNAYALLYQRIPFLGTDQQGNLYEARSEFGRRSVLFRLKKYSVDQMTSVQDVKHVQKEFSLLQNYPNPFNPVTIIRYSVQRESHVSMKIFNVLGEEVTMLVDERKDPGSYSITWNASGFPSGMYFYRLQAGEFSESKKLLILK